MKRLLVSVILFGSLSAVASFAKDKEKESLKPSWTAEQKLEYRTKQLVILDAIIEVQPKEIHIQELREDANAFASKANQGVDLAKWKQNPQTLEFEAVPEAPKAEEKPAEVPKSELKPDPPKN